MSISKLLELSPPPSHPVEGASDSDWALVEKMLGREYPSDVKEISGRYGSGCFGAFIWVLNPSSKNQHLRLPNILEQLNIEFTNLRADGFPIPYEWHDSPNGNLLWGVTDNGDRFYWNGVETVVVESSNSMDWEEFRMSVSSFLHKTLNRSIRPRCFPADWSTLNIRRFYPLGEDYFVDIENAR